MHSATRIAGHKAFKFPSVRVKRHSARPKITAVSGSGTDAPGDSAARTLGHQTRSLNFFQREIMAYLGLMPLRTYMWQRGGSHAAFCSGSSGPS